MARFYSGRLCAREYFVFQLAAEEVEATRSQIVTTSAPAMRSQSVTTARRNLRFLPRAFTEHGALDASPTETRYVGSQISLNCITI